MTIIEVYFPGFPIICPACKSDRVVLFFDPRFIPREIPRWKDLIYEKKTVLENSWEKIKLENQWKKDVKVSGKPNWICKECYDGGIVLEKLSEDVKNC
ncbi:MAG: hypothetical protein MAG458_01348 [Nitrosopumilus sp.]|nr:hypothetical protein [Nitrosopumilus sp.]